jgi:methionyl-tRNA formyltransferase
MRLAFMGTPDFAVTALRALHEAGHELVAVYSQPPKPAGRGQKLQLSAVQLYAAQHGLPIFTPQSLRTPVAQADFAALELDCAIVAAYGLILPPAILQAPRLGCLNIHASLLPRWRGAAPIHRALLAGDTETGITIMQMDAGLDTGAMLRWRSMPIAATATATMLHDALAQAGADLLLSTLDDYENGMIAPIPQPAEGISYAHKLEKSEGALDWSRSAPFLERQLRGLQPWPGCWFHYNNETIKLLSASFELCPSGDHAAGQLLDRQGLIACGSDALRLLRVQRPGKAPVSATDFINGMRLLPGMFLQNG